jgi:hypothetical protein
MDSARPVGGRPGTELLATGETKLSTGNLRNTVTWRSSFAVRDTATVRLRPRYRDGESQPASGEALHA